MIKAHNVTDEKLIKKEDGGFSAINVVCHTCGQTWTDSKAYVNSNHNTTCGCGPEGCAP